jgi:hypothetical protein
VVKLLLTCGEHEVRTAVHALQHPILKIWHGTILGNEAERCHSLRLLRPARHQSKSRSPPQKASMARLFDFAAALLPVPFACQCLLDPQFFPRLQVKGVAFDLFDDVFLLHLAFEAPKGVFQGFTILESDFSQNLQHLQTDRKLHPDR